MFSVPKSMCVVLFCVVFSAAVVTAKSDKVENSTVENDKVYEIFSRVDGEVSVLTVLEDASEKSTFRVFLKPRNNTASQKWRAVNPSSSHKTVFQFRPTSYEKLVLEYSHGHVVVKQMKKGIKNKLVSLATHNLECAWLIKPAGDGYSEIVNNKNHDCLTSDGRDKSVKLEKCENSQSQQWRFKPL